MTAQLIEQANNIKCFRLSDEKGQFADILNYGGRIHKLCVFNKTGDLVDVVAGFNNIEEYQNSNPYFNAVIGRVANRIGGASFSLNGKTYHLNANEKGNQLHGGFNGFDSKIFDSQIEDNALVLSYTSADGEEGYPCKLHVKVKYSFYNGSLKIEYSAKADGDTHCNLTNHAYFNLDGSFDKPIYDTELYLNASRMLEIDDDLIPTGNILDIRNTPCDFKVAKKIGRDINCDYKPLKQGGGYDFAFILDDNKSLSASAYSKTSGICLETYTDAPSIQFYSGNFLDGINGKRTINYRGAFCLETQGYPSACNIEAFPSTLLKEGDTFQRTTIYTFSLK